MDDGLDYDVETKVSFVLNFDGDGALNIMALPTVHQQFVEHVREIYEQDDTLCAHIRGNLNFRFDGPRVRLEYTFSCHDENTAEAESFSTYCVRGVQKELEKFGCKVTRVKCIASEADMTWLDQLEDAVFGPRKQSHEEEKGSALPSRKKGKKRSGPER